METIKIEKGVLNIYSYLFNINKDEIYYVHNNEYVEGDTNEYLYMMYKSVKLGYRDDYGVDYMYNIGRIKKDFKNIININGENNLEFYNEYDAIDAFFIGHDSMDFYKAIINNGKTNSYLRRLIIEGKEELNLSVPILIIKEQLANEGIIKLTKVEKEHICNINNKLGYQK